MSARYAVFFCPEDSTRLASFGQQVLGRSADGSTVTASGDDYPDEREAASLSATAAHYGFHATLKAPFVLAGSMSDVALMEAVEALAAKQTPVRMETLRPRVLANFVALGFANQPDSIAQLAEQCVLQLEPFRAPLTIEDIEKRKPDQLTDTQKSYLYEYGYPYVLSEFRFHMTLTGPITVSHHERYIDWLIALYDSLVHEPPLLDRLAIFWQPDRLTPFKRIAQFAFKGSG